MRKRWLPLTLTTLLATLGVLRAGDDLKSGPAPGKNLPGSFQAVNVNAPEGTVAKDRVGHPHCMICEYQLNPVVLTFIREGPDANPQVIEDYLKAVEKAVERNRKINFLSGYVVFITPDAKSAATEAKIDDPDALIKEAQVRTKLEERLTALAKQAGLKYVVAAYMPDGPKGYNLSPQPGVTVVLYEKLHVQKVLAFPEAKFNEAAKDEVLKEVTAMLKGAKKKKS
jgi:hypothetical protein